MMINKRLKIKNQKRSGFTLVEILVVIVIIGILSSIGMITYLDVQKRGRDEKRKQDLAQIAIALEQFRINSPTQEYPDILMNKVSLLEPLIVPTYITSIPLDPLKGETGCPYIYLYLYYNSAKKYTLFANLENSDDPDAKRAKSPPVLTAGVGSCTPGPDCVTFKLNGSGFCGGGPPEERTFNYWINSPN